jgi:hypothetical protein
MLYPSCPHPLIHCLEALYRYSLMSLCLMVIQCNDYVAADSKTRKIAPSETALFANAICKSIITFLGVKNVRSISTILFKEKQGVVDEMVDREGLWTNLALFRVLDTS